MTASTEFDPRARNAAYMRDYRRGVRRPVVKVPLVLRLLAFADRLYGDTPSLEMGRCWPFLGARNAQGYGVIRDDDGKLQLAHRLALSIALGRPLAEGMQANHKCDNRPCIRPRHLYEGTAHENVWDCIQRGRHVGFETKREEAA